MSWKKTVTVTESLGNFSKRQKNETMLIVGALKKQWVKAVMFHIVGKTLPLIPPSNESLVNFDLVY